MDCPYCSSRDDYQLHEIQIYSYEISLTVSSYYLNKLENGKV